MKYLLSTATLFALPAMALAQFGDIDDFFGDINQFINDTLVPLVFGIAFLVFIWGVFKYFIQGGGDSEAQEKGKQLMLYAVIGFVLMVSIWGIVNLLSEGFGFDDQNINTIPNTPSSNR